MLTSARFGIVDAERGLVEADLIPFSAGTSYGYELEVLASQEDFEIYDYLFTPHSSGEASTLDLLAHPAEAQRLADCMPDRVVTGERAFECTERIRYGRAFRIMESDPVGSYRLLLFVGAQKIGDWVFELTKDQGEPARAGNGATRRT